MGVVTRASSIHFIHVVPQEGRILRTKSWRHRHSEETAVLSSSFSIRGGALKEAFGASDKDGDRKCCTDIDVLLDHPRRRAANVDTGAPHER
jgi:hypothetical protein